MLTPTDASIPLEKVMIADLSLGGSRCPWAVSPLKCRGAWNGPHCRLSAGWGGRTCGSRAGPELQVPAIHLSCGEGGGFGGRAGP